MSEPNQPVETDSLPADAEMASEQAAASDAVSDAADSAEIAGAAGESEATAAEAHASAKPRVHPKEVVARFASAWPQAFSTDPKAVKPLTVGVLKQMLANRPEALEGLNSQAIRAGMKFYAGRMAYHIAVLNHSHRVDLAGEQAEEITDDMRTHAQEQLDAIKAKRAEQDKDKPKRKGNGPRRKAGPRGGESNEAGPGAERRKKRPPRSSGRRPEAEARKKAADAPAVDENLSMEEKLARLAERFGK